MKVQNYSSIDDSVLNIKVNKPEQDKRNISIEKWVVIMMNQNIFKIQLEFSREKDISAGDVRIL